MTIMTGDYINDFYCVRGEMATIEQMANRIKEKYKCELVAQYGKCSCGWYPKPFGIIGIDNNGDYICPECRKKIIRGEMRNNCQKYP